MKRIYLFFMLCLLSYFNSLQAQYCTPINPSGCSLDAISYFSLKGEAGTVIYNPTGVSCSISYTDFTSVFSPVTMSIGSSYSGFLQTSDPEDYASIWIDQNNNNVFESSERILNNLKIGPTKLLYSIYVPTTFATGIHRMRVRMIYSSVVPASPIDPCTSYTYGETEDYLVNLNNIPGSRFVSNGTAGTCMTSSKTTIDAGSNNTSVNFVHLLDSMNNLICMVFPSGNTFGTVSANLYTQSGSPRITSGGQYYLNRNLTLQSTIAPTSTYNFRLFYTNAELNSLIAQPGSGVTSQFDLFGFINNDACASAVSNLLGTTIYPTGYGSLNGDRFVDITGVNGIGTWYLSGSVLASSCFPPTSLNTVLSSYTAGTLSWASGGSGTTSYQYAITSSSTPPASGTATSFTSAPFSSLSANQIYYAHVRAVCGSSFSTWTTLQFNTVYNDISCNAVALTIGNAICENSSNATSNGDPSIACSAPNNTRWYRFTPASTGNYILRASIPLSGDPLHGWVIWFSTTGTCLSSGLTQIPTSTCYEFGQTGNGDIDDFVSPLLTAGQTYYIMIDGFADDIGEYCLTMLNSLPPCVTNSSPLNGATGVASAATLSWGTSPSATSYNVYIGTTNPPLDLLANTVSTSIGVSNLNYNTTYYWYVSPVNSSGAGSCSLNTTSFTTSNPLNCLPLYGTGCTSGDYISYFSLKGEAGTGVYNPSGTTCNPSPNKAFSNYTSLPAISLSKGESYAGFIQAGHANNYVSIWIDQDNDGYFEDDERLLNNLSIGTTSSLYSIHIPVAMALGSHRMRVRMVDYGSTPPSSPTDPCNYYNLGETEDYTVTINNTPGSHSVSSGVANSCNFSARTTIDAASNNATANGVKLVDSSNNYICSIYPDGNNLGIVQSSFYRNSGALRMNANGTYYLDRNLHINPQYNPTSPYRLRYYYKISELNAIIAQPGSGITSQFDLALFQNGDNCNASMSNLGGSLTQPTGFGSLGADKFVDLTNLTLMSEYYLHKSCIPVNVSSSHTACSSYTWGGNTYTSSGVYTHTFVSSTGCDSVHVLTLTIQMPATGTADVSPASICLGSSCDLTYTPPCSIQNGFANAYSPAAWVLSTEGNSNGTINSTTAPGSIVMTSSDGLSGSGSTNWTITPTCNGVISFDWTYTTVDGPFYDFPLYSINGGVDELLPGFDQFTSSQSGTASIPVNAGETFTLKIHSVDNLYGPCTVNISNFSGPVASLQSVDWYSAPTGGTFLGSGLSINYTPLTSGTHQYYAQVTDLTLLCVISNRIASNTQTVNPSPCNSTLNLKLFIQGYYTGGGMMAPVLYNQGAGTNVNETDLVTVELHDPISYTLMTSTIAMLQTNGLLTCQFPGYAGDYYVAIKYRNGLQTWSANPVTIGALPVFYDFSDDATKAYGGQMVHLDTGVWGIYSGDINQDENIDLLDAAELETDISNFAFGYYSTDITGDGNVDLLDAPIVETNINNFVFSIHP